MCHCAFLDAPTSEGSTKYHTPTSSISRLALMHIIPNRKGDHESQSPPQLAMLRLHREHFLRLEECAAHPPRAYHVETSNTTIINNSNHHLRPTNQMMLHMQSHGLLVDNKPRATEAALEEERALAVRVVTTISTVVVAESHIMRRPLPAPLLTARLLRLEAHH
jgi:hypothetical protein